MASSEDQDRVSPLPKACENCRIRKIRCNRVNPCSNCTSSGIACRAPTKPTEHRPRMVVSNHYEQQIDRIHERLIGIEQALRSASISQTSSPPQSHTTPNSTQPANTSTPSQFEGDSSFQSQSVRATEVARLLDTKQDDNLSSAIESLKNVIDAKDITHSSTHDVHFIPRDLRGSGPQMELLPAELVIKLLSKVKEKVPMCFYNNSLPGSGYLEHLCQRAYFPTVPMSLGEMTSLYGILYCIIDEYIVFEDAVLTGFDSVKYLNVCETNFHAGIETYDLLVEASFDNTLALMLAALKAQNEGKALLCWSLSSAAARHLQALGYNRERTLKHDTPASADGKRRLFWAVYGIEKNMCLNLGRASTFQDWDIDVKMIEVPCDPTVAPWIAGTIVFIEWTRLQGEIYEKLYSASASRKTHTERMQAIEELSDTLDRVYSEFRKVDRDQAVYGDLFHMFYESSDVIYYSLLTLMHRAATNPDDGSEISSNCFEAAKKCLKSHLHYFPMFVGKGEAITTGYVNWILLYCSFTPFIVVFLHAIASRNLADVRLMHDMTNSLEPFSTLSVVLSRLHEVCRVFSRVAEVIVGNQNEPHPGTVTELGSYDHQTDSLLFPGFTGNHTFEQHQLPDIFMQGSTMDLNGSNMDDMSAYFGNWVSSNQPSMNLFSMDFGNNNWGS